MNESQSLRLLRNSRGMTLVEIMIVVGILAGLLAVLVTNVSGTLKKARVKETKIQMSEIGKALEMFYTDCGFYPTAEQGLQALTEAPSNCSNWGPEPYIKKSPKDPWGMPFTYELNGSNYVLKSFGSDKKEGGSGVDADITNEDL